MRLFTFLAFHLQVMQGKESKFLDDVTLRIGHATVAKALHISHFGHMGADQSKEPELAQLRNEVVELKSKLNGLMLLIAVVVPTATLAGYFICKAVCT